MVWGVWFEHGAVLLVSVVSSGLCSFAKHQVVPMACRLVAMTGTQEGRRYGVSLVPPKSEMTHPCSSDDQKTARAPLRHSFLFYKLNCEAVWAKPSTLCDRGARSPLSVFPGRI